MVHKRTRSIVNGLFENGVFTLIEIKFRIGSLPSKLGLQIFSEIIQVLRLSTDGLVTSESSRYVIV